MTNKTLQLVQVDGAPMTIPNAPDDVIAQAKNAMIRQEGLVEFTHDGGTYVLAGRHIIRVVTWEVEDPSDPRTHSFGYNEL